MTTQAARVALWVPTTSPTAGAVIVTTDAPTEPQAPIATEFLDILTTRAATGETSGPTTHSGG